MSAEAETASGAPRTCRGLWSFLIAPPTFGVLVWMVVNRLRPVAMAYQDLDVPPETPIDAAVRLLFTPALLTGACLQVLGIWLGCVAMVRRHDDRVLGGFGVVLNVLALLFTLFVLAIAHPVSRVAAAGVHFTWI